MKICDIHTHSSNSFDAENTVEEMCKSAVDKGLFALAITDTVKLPKFRQALKVSTEISVS